MVLERRYKVLKKPQVINFCKSVLIDNLLEKYSMDILDIFLNTINEKPSLVEALFSEDVFPILIKKLWSHNSSLVHLIILFISKSMDIINVMEPTMSHNMKCIFEAVHKHGTSSTTKHISKNIFLNTCKTLRTKDVDMVHNFIMEVVLHYLQREASFMKSTVLKGLCHLVNGKACFMNSITRSSILFHIFPLLNSSERNVRLYSLRFINSFFHNSFNILNPSLSFLPILSSNDSNNLCAEYLLTLGNMAIENNDSLEYIIERLSTIESHKLISSTSLHIQSRALILFETLFKKCDEDELLKIVTPEFIKEVLLCLVTKDLKKCFLSLTIIEHILHKLSFINDIFLQELEKGRINSLLKHWLKDDDPEITSKCNHIKEELLMKCQ